MRNQNKFQVNDETLSLFSSVADSVIGGEKTLTGYQDFHANSLSDEIDQDIVTLEEVGDPNEIIDYLISLIPEYYAVIDFAHPDKIQAFFEKGFPVNFQNPVDGTTAMHVLAGTRSRSGIVVLAAIGEYDFLLRDHKGRLASEYAFLFGDDSGLATYLRLCEKKQAEAQGVKLTRRPFKQ